jgi:cold shock CspA family protein
MNGCVVKTYPNKSFGFIKGDDGKEYFLHRSSILNFHVFHSSDFYSCIKVGDYVEFTPTVTAEGPRAIHVLVEMKNSAEGIPQSKTG